jgi:small subunit ribosomal protein S2
MNTPLLASWMLFIFRQNTWLINLLKTFYMFKLSFKLLKHIVRHHGPIWFINLNKSMDRIVKFAALRCGEFFASSYWIKGMLSNFKYALASFSKYSNITNDFFKNQKISKFFLNFKNWYLTRFSYPRGIFVFSAYSSALAVREALCLGIPCMAIVDTNISGHAACLAIPGNDDSLDALIFYSEIVSTFILLSKFLSVFSWYVNIRKSSRLVNFTQWLKKLKKRNIKYIYKSYIKRFFGFVNLFSINYKRLLLNSFISKFAIGYWADDIVENLQFLAAGSFTIEKTKIFSIFSQNWSKFLSVVRIYFFNKLLRNTDLIFRAKNRKSVLRNNFHAKRFIAKRMFVRVKAFSFFAIGSYVFKVLSLLFKGLFSTESFLGPFHFFIKSLMGHRTQKFKSIVYNPPFRDPWIKISLLHCFKRKTLSFPNKYKILVTKRPSYFFKTFMNNYDFLRKRYCFHSFLIHIYIRLIFKHLGYKFSMDLNFQNKDLNLKKKKIIKIYKLKKKLKIPYKLKFSPGWMQFENLLSPNYWLINSLHFFSDRIPMFLIWYFWRFYRVNISTKLPYIYSFYKGPAFYNGIYNFFFKRALMPFISMDSNMYQQSFSYLDFENYYVNNEEQWKFLKNLKKKLPLSKNLIKMDYFLSSLYDMRLDFIRKYYLKNLLINYLKL